MLDHVSLGVGNLEKSRAFYDAALKPLGCRRVYDLDMLSGYGASTDKPAFWIAGPEALELNAVPSAGSHVAFAAESRAAVDAFHAAALAAGGRDNGKPGLRPEYHESYYGAFVLDPDGHHIEAVCHRPE
ncbi:MAG: glyoxalase [Alphaproteobacteria bacterium]|nr:MAG: glyoxalase [Alphaproteobacteria bacterium]